jgi:hypothetical protein
LQVHEIHVNDDSSCVILVSIKIEPNVDLIEVSGRLGDIVIVNEVRGVKFVGFDFLPEFGTGDLAVWRDFGHLGIGGMGSHGNIDLSMGNSGETGKQLIDKVIH